MKVTVFNIFVMSDLQLIVFIKCIKVQHRLVNLHVQWDPNIMVLETNNHNYR